MQGHEAKGRGVGGEAFQQGLPVCRVRPPVVSRPVKWAQLGC